MRFKKGEYNKDSPIFQQIVDHMLAEIAAGVLAAGAQVAAVRVLALEYKVNPNTMQRALEKLGDMGYLRAERTSGRFVTDDTELIGKLKREIPNRMTAGYVQEMLDFGVVRGDITNYVNNYLEGLDGNDFEN